jgi:hypothetical protein
VLWLAARAGHIAADATLRSSLVKLAVAGIAMTILLFIAAPLVGSVFSSWSKFRSEAELIVLAIVGGAFYGALALALFGRRWLSLLRKRAQTAAAAPIEAFEGTTPPPAGPDDP